MAMEAREKMVRSAEARSMATAHSRTIFRLSACDKEADASRSTPWETEEEEEESSGTAAAALHVTCRRRRIGA